ncbi:hypothetical protein [Clostridium sp.]|uniref:hypothetical protein n=1 Tax=Clostridium sp. TaxID=1506 RepID=UPI003D6CBDEA
MIFSDVSNNYNELHEKLQGLDTFKTQLKGVEAYYMEYSSYLIGLHVHSQVNGSNVNSVTKEALTRLENIQSQSRKISLKDVWKTNYILESFENIDSEMYEPIRKLATTLESCCDLLFDFINTPLDKCVPQKLTIFISVISTTIREIDNFLLISSCLKNINSEVQNNNLYPESRTITIRFYREDMTVKEIGKYMVAVNTIYERVCTIVGISATDYALRPIKIESGSWYEKLFGHPTSIKMMQDLLNRAIGYVYRNYTNEGKLSASGSKIEALKQELNIIGLCEEHKINGDIAKKIIEENLNLICMDIFTLTTKNTKIAVNERIFELGQEVATSLLEGDNTKLLEEEELDDLLPQDL